MLNTMKGPSLMNGEELSMEQIYDLTLLHKAGRGIFAEGISLTICTRIYTSVVRITLNFLGGAATGFLEELVFLTSSFYGF